MRKIINKILFILLLILFFSFNSNVSAEKLNGWKSEDGYTYYYKDGVMYRGIHKIDGEKYHFGENTGQLKTGWSIMMDKTRYYSDENGVLQTGIQIIDGKNYHFGENTGQLKTGWSITLDKRIYYSNEDGELLLGWQEIDGNKYYFSYEKGMYKGIYEIDGKNYHFGENTGQLKTGKSITLDKRNYLSDENGELILGWQEMDGNKYYYSYEEGMYKGIYEIDGKKYHFGENTGQLKTGWSIKLDKTRYYSDENGVLQTGIQIIDGKKYHFGENTGQLKIGWSIMMDKTRYYSDKDGVLQTGIKIIDGKKYHFGENTCQLKTGWSIMMDKTRYYSDENGVLQTGIITIDGKKYHFGENTCQLKIGWSMTLDKKNYYSDKDGVIQTGKQIIDGIEYKFDDVGGWLCGWKNENGKRYFYYTNGTQARGWVNLAGVKYYFNEDGEMIGENVKKVIDISSWQDTINWEQVKNDGVDGAIIRVGWGMTSYDAPGIDSKFAYNISEVKRLNIPYALYIYGYAEYDFSAKNEAKFVKEMMEKYGISKNTYVFYDAEEPIPLSTYEMVIPTFIETMHSYGYNNVGVYGSVSFFDYGRLNSNRIKQYPVWVAQYYKRNQYDGNYVGWQYCSDGRINGINGNVDVNMFKVEFKN